MHVKVEIFWSGLELFAYVAEDKNQHVTIRVKIMTILLLIILTMLNIKFSSCRLHSRIFSLPSE